MWESLKKASEEVLWALLLATINGLRGAVPLGKTNVKKTLITGVLTRLLSIISPMESPSSRRSRRSVGGDKQKDLQRCILWLHKPILLGKLAIGKTLEPLEPETWPGNRPQDGEKAEK